MNIFIVGAGEIGRHIGIRLSQENHAITIIEKDEAISAEFDQQIDARVLNSDGASVKVLVDAEVSECELFIALTSDTNINLVSCSLAKSLGAGQVICRVHPGLQREEFLFNFREHFGIDYVFSPERLVAVEMAKFIRYPLTHFVEELAGGQIELQQLSVSPNSSMAGKTLVECEFPSRVRVAAVKRGIQSFIPKSDDKILAGDELTLFGEPRFLGETAAKLRNAAEKTDVANIVIFGGGEYGFSVAQTLQGWNCRIRILESDANRSQELIEALPKTTVLNIDGTSLPELKEENVGDADFFIATSAQDEDNVMTCLQAHSLGTNRCLTLIHRADYADAITGLADQVGIRQAISPRNAVLRDLGRFLTSKKFHLVRRLNAGELIEARVAEDSQVCGKLIKDIDWPNHCVLVALWHGIHATAPSAEDEVKENDFIYAVVSPKSRRKFVKLVSG